MDPTGAAEFMTIMDDSNQTLSSVYGSNRPVARQACEERANNSFDNLQLIVSIDDTTATTNNDDILSSSDSFTTRQPDHDILSTQPNYSTARLQSSENNNALRGTIELPDSPSYTDIEESITLESPKRSRFLAWFSKHFILPPPNSGDTNDSVSGRATSESQICQHPGTRWSLNYREAAIYIEEGYNNVKFEYHPKSYSKLPAYLAVHNHAYYLIDLIACLLLLSLAIFEKPAVDGLHLSESIHASIELFCLLTIGAVFWVKFHWMGWRFFRHWRTVIKTFVLGLMVAEAIVVLLRQDSHFRVTRSLRPVFLIDNYYFGGVRRVIRQTIQSLRSFLEMLLLQMFFLLFFSISAFYLFSSVPNYEQFSSIWNSFLSLFVLLTTSNYPDVMMPAYKQGQLYVLFFVFFLVVNLYFLLNIMLAVVYTAFSQIEKDKFRKLLLHRRKACENAFQLLVSAGKKEAITFAHFCGLLDFLKPTSSLLERYLMYQALLNEDNFDFEVSRSQGASPVKRNVPQQQQNDNYLTLDKFYNIYEVLNLRWRDDTEASLPWFERVGASVSLMTPLRAVLRWLHIIVNHQLFTVASYAVIILATAYQLLDAIFGQAQWEAELGLPVSTALICAVFIGLYTAELVLKLLALGPTEYFRHRWNVFDFIVTSVSLITFLLARYQVTTSVSTSLFSLRSLRLIDLLRQNVHRYRDILGPFAFIIFKRFTSVMLVVLIVYYFFAIIAMEIFGKFDMRDCCKNSSIEAYYQTTGSGQLFYFLNNFNDLASSYVTLFELMVVNNWPIIMKSYVIVTGSQFYSLFFMIFFMISLLVITIVIAFVIDTIQFQIKYKHRFGEETLKAKIKVVVRLAAGDLQALLCHQNRATFTDSHDSSSSSGLEGSTTLRSRFEHTFSKWSFLGLIFGGCSQLQHPSSSASFERMTSPYSSNLNLIAQSRLRRSAATQGTSHAINMTTEEIVADPRGELTFTGTRFRDKFSYNLRMYSDEIQKWIM